MGGLGNQLFQLAAGIEISKLAQKPVKFSTQILEMAGTSATTKRSLGIGDLLDSSEVITQSFSKAAIRHLSGKLRVGNKGVFEGDLSEDATLRVTSDTKYVQGYFQNWKIVERAWTSLETRLRMSDVFSPMLLDPVINRTAIHMRYGDYRLNAKAREFHGLTHPSYFINGLRYLEESGASKSVLLLSDEPELALRDLKNFGLPTSFTIEIGNSKNQFEDLAAISSSTSVVASNSSFSWWGSWVAMKRSNARVILPRPWFSPGSSQVPDLNFPGWHTIERKIQE